MLLRKALDFLKKHPDAIFFGLLGFLVVSFLLTYLIDVIDLFGVKEYMVNGLEVPYFWYYWFEYPVEVPFQWYILGLTTLIYLFIAGMAYERKQERIFKFWSLIGLGVLFMLVEDAGDVRHAYRSLLERFTGSEAYGFLGTTFELFYFAFIGLIMLYAIVKYRDVYWNYYNTRKYFALGFILYGVGVSASFIGGAYRTIIGFTLYERIGHYFLSTVFIRNEITERAYQVATMNSRADFMFMDRVFEESLELLGAGALLVAGIYFCLEYKSKCKD